MREPPYRVTVSFGDCDPAGIVYYPNILAWVDGAFHHYLRGFGGHAALCDMMGSTGMGAVDVRCQFARPLRDGDALEIDITDLSWTEKRFELTYAGRTDQGVHFTATETRGIFVQEGDRLRLGPTGPLRRILAGEDHG